MNSRTPFPPEEPVSVGLIGTGAFGNSFLSQSRSIPRLQVVGVCDLDMTAAHAACLRAGWPADALATCTTKAEAARATAANQVVLTEDASLLMDLSMDALVDATGSPEAGAGHAQDALAHGKHVVMVTKETDCVVGPILSKMAQEQGLVYTQADGDQPSMLIGLIAWAQALGLDVICAGKASEMDVVYNVASGTVGNRKATVDVEADGRWPLWAAPTGGIRETVEERAHKLSPLAEAAVADLCEMSIVMNATGFGFDNPSLHAPIMRITELAEVWGLREDGGILAEKGIIDVVNCLRREDGVSFAGGVFVVFACQDRSTWEFLRAKGHVVSKDLTRAAVFLPYHFLGVQTANSIFSAVDRGLPTGGVASQPRVDVGVVASEPLATGQTLTMSRGHELSGTRAKLVPAAPMGPGQAIPYYLAAGHKLAQDVSPGTVLTYDHVDPGTATALWTLRQRQDSEF